MAAKAVVALAALTAVVLGATYVAFWYYDRRARERHEKDMHRQKMDERIMTGGEDEIDRELERERE